ncbi:hypothetical protein R1flu_017359 [Riccia fluitans]|uniref:Uncharacterized protein n=1 Tax=Riccia fluitans TaxID=41844 RepID=A0ABD1ZCQ7_9MARC
MAPHSRKDLKVKTKEVKIPHLTNVNKKKMEAWGLGGLFAVDWSQIHEDLWRSFLVILIRRLPSPNTNTEGSRERGLPTCGGKFTTCQKQL